MQGLLSVLSKIVEWLAKFVVFLFKALGLWIPFLYSLVFVIVCACCGTDVLSVWVVYFIGLVISVLFALYAMCARMIKRRSRKYLDKKQKRAVSGETVEQNTKALREEEASKELERRMEKEKTVKKEKDLPFTSQKPLVFRTRTDPNILIYEYSDRLVYFRKTLNGLEHVRTERKSRY